MNRVFLQLWFLLLAHLGCIAIASLVLRQHSHQPRKCSSRVKCGWACADAQSEALVLAAQGAVEALSRAAAVNAKLLKISRLFETI
jgi:hypothetical protein